MRLTGEELKMLEQVSKGNRNIGSIAAAMKKSRSQSYRLAKSLKEKGILEAARNAIEPRRLAHIALLLPLLAQYPSIIKPLSGSGIAIFTALLTPRSIAGIMQETGLKKAMIFRKLKEAKAISLVEGKRGYAINARLWPKAKEFLEELKQHEKASDRRIPLGAVVHFKKRDEIIFSTAESTDAAITGFSAYKTYGIEVLSKATDYCLPKRKLSKQDIFLHSLYIAESEKDARSLVFIALFYLKFRKSLAKVSHIILDKIKLALAGNEVEGYPSLDEIREKAKLYGIKA